MSHSEDMELSAYLHRARREGENLGEGSFTMERTRALQKLASFTLPFEAAWAVKIVQSIVSSGASGEIVVRSRRQEIEFRFNGEIDWTPSALEEAFYRPDPEKIRALNHLKCALWVVGLAQQRAFRLVFPNSSEALVWDGETLKKLQTRKTAKHLSVAVSTLGKGPGQSSWTSRQKSAGQEHLAVQKALSTHCCACPFPLKIDGLRRDGYEMMPDRASGSNSIPLFTVPAVADLPSLRVPPTSLEKAQDSSIFANSSVVTLLSATLEEVPGGWNARRLPSVFAWVRDGAVVQMERCGVRPTACTATIFLSAEGLQDDLTGFQLRDSREKERRKRTALGAAAQAHLAISSISEKSFRDPKTTGPGRLAPILLALGAGGMLFAAPVGAFFLAGGVVSAILNDSRKSSFQKWLAGEFKQLAVNLEVAAERQRSHQTPG